jgi:hypothetical protein
LGGSIAAWLAQGSRVSAASFFWAVPNVPSWYTEAPVGEKLNASNGSANISSR